MNNVILPQIQYISYKSVNVPNTQVVVSVLQL